MIGRPDPGGQRAAVERMVVRMRHRGPDDRGVEQVVGGKFAVTLGAVRLAIIDLSPAGHMPMADEATGNLIVFNGEVYNFRELEARGEAFRSGTDTEVILRAYKHWGPAAVGRLRGMFAFAIWDARNHKLFLARDRLGKKPLYYASAPGLFIFASEVRAVVASGLVPACLDPEALEVYLWNGFVVSPLTMVAGVRSLLPGWWLQVGPDGAVIEAGRYWRLPEPVGRAAADGVDGVRAELEEAVRLRLVSDVPLGVFLSGGLDSSTVTALAARAGGRVKTFSVAFEEADYDESLFARWVARRFETDHTEVLLTRRRFADWLPGALAGMDQPTFDGVNTYCVARAAKEAGLTVALSGLGADELFGGYPYFRTVPRVRQLFGLGCRLPPAASGLAARLLGDHRLAGPAKVAALLPAAGQVRGLRAATAAAYQAAQMLFPPAVRRTLLAPELRARPEKAWFGLPPELLEALADELPPAEDAPGLVSRLVLRLFLGERCLRDADALSMAVSLEVRAPFTDHGLLAAAFRVPAAVRCRGAPNKPFEWQLAKPYLGPDYPYRPKQGFVFPFERWLRDPELFGPVESVLRDRGTVAAAGLDPAGVGTVLEGFRAGKVPWSRVWALFALCHWCWANRVGRC